jgi:uncharacterized protein involved in exopolysaccharide biosynthesis
MKPTAIILASIMLSAAVARADVSDDPLLDARMEVAQLRLVYTEQHPQLIEAEARLAALSKSYPETPEQYREHLRERLAEAEADKAALALNYLPAHPKMIQIQAEIDFLNQELQRTAAIGSDPDDPLLDARLEVAELKLTYTERHPKLIAAETRLAAITKSFSETPQEYCDYVRERLAVTEADKTAMELRYSSLHPKMIQIQAVIDFLNQELERTSGS